MRSRPLASWLPLAALTLFLLAVLVWITGYAWGNAKFTTLDELWAVQGGRLMERDFFGLLTDTGHFNRGPERLASMIMAASFSVFDNAPDDLRGARLLISAAWLLAAIPLYALARGLGLLRWPAVLVAAIGVVGPWIVFPTTMLNTALAFPLTVAFAWSVWRAAVRPSVLGDVLVIVFAVLNTLARTSDATFVVVAVVAVVYAVWHRRPREESAGRSLLRLPLRIARAHPVLTLAGLAGLVLILVIGTERFVGQAYAASDTADFEFPIGFIWEHLVQWFSQTALAMAFVPVVVGGAWALRETVRPHSTEGGVFAVVMLSIFLVFVYVTGSQNSQIEERYVAIVGGLPAVAFGVAVFRRQAWVLGTVVLGLLAAWAVAAKAEFVDAQPFSYLVAPARLIYQQVVLGRLSTVVPNTAAEIIATLGMAAVAIAVALVFSGRLDGRLPILGRRPQAAGLAVSAGVLVVLLVMSAYTLRKYEPATFPGATLEQMAWIDDATGGDPAMVWGYASTGVNTGRHYQSSLAMYFNDSACCYAGYTEFPDQVGPEGQLPIFAGDPDYIVWFGGFHPIGFETEPVTRSEAYGEPMRVDRFVGEPGAAFRITNAGVFGQIGPGGTATFELLPKAKEPNRCVDLELHVPEDTPERRSRSALPFRVEGAGRTRTGTIRPGGTRKLSIPTDGIDAFMVKGPTRGKVPLMIGESALVRC